MNVLPRMPGYRTRRWSGCCDHDDCTCSSIAFYSHGWLGLVGHHYDAVLPVTANSPGLIRVAAPSAQCYITCSFFADFASAFQKLEELGVKTAGVAPITFNKA